MSFILAIEPDSDQAHQLTHVVGPRLKAEVIIAPTAQRAVAAMGSRVPDVVLVPALLSPQDELTIVTALRSNPRAGHVQMLRTPVLTRPAAKTKPSRVLSVLRVEKEADGVGPKCSPSAFADQIATYLQRKGEGNAPATASVGPLSTDELATAEGLTSATELPSAAEDQLAEAFPPIEDLVSERPPEVSGNPGPDDGQAEDWSSAIPARGSQEDASGPSPQEPTSTHRMNPFMEVLEWAFGSTSGDAARMSIAPTPNAVTPEPDEWAEPFEDLSAVSSKRPPAGAAGSPPSPRPEESGTSRSATHLDPSRCSFGTLLANLQEIRAARAHDGPTRPRETGDGRRP